MRTDRSTPFTRRERPGRSPRHLLGACLAAAVIAGCGGPETEEPTATPDGATAAAASACGDTLVTLDGVKAKYNGSNQGTGESCGGGYCDVASGNYGRKYQCVEFARRYWAKVKGGTFGCVDSAYQICDLQPSGWVRHYPYDGYLPVHGDLFVMPQTSSFADGHVAVIDSVSGGSMNWNASVVEQNASSTGRNTYNVGRARCILHKT